MKLKLYGGVMALSMGMAMSSWAFTLDVFEPENPNDDPSLEVSHYDLSGIPQLANSGSGVGTGDIIIMEYGTTVADESNPNAWSDILRFGGSATQSPVNGGTTYDMWLISDPATLLAGRTVDSSTPSFIWEDANGFAQWIVGDNRDTVNGGQNVYNIHSDGDNVPDAGSTSALLALALAGLGAARRFMRS